MTLSKPGCARLYVSANAPKAPEPFEGRAACRACALGAFHATGRIADPTAILTEALRQLCPRCGRPSDRLIWGLMCPSCDARQREAVRGRNSEGNRPALSNTLHTEQLAVGQVGMHARIMVRPVVTSLAEVVIHASRSATGLTGFGRRRVSYPALVRSWHGWVSQLELAL